MRTGKIAVSARCFSQTLKESIRAAARIGANGIQFDGRSELKPTDLSATGRRQFLHFLEEEGLSVASLAFPTRRAFYDADQLEARVAAAKTMMQFAAQLNSRVVTARIGRIPDDPNSDEYQLLGEVLNDLAQHGNHVGSVLAITPSGDSAENLARLIACVDQGPIGINFDPAALVISGNRPSEAFRELYQWVQHVQIRDAVGNADGTGIEVPVGRGEVEWDELLAIIDEAAFRGWLTVERTQGDDKAGDAARAIEFLEQLMPG